MRHTRWLFLAAIVSIVVFVGVTYIRSKADLAKNAPVPSKPLAAGIKGEAKQRSYVAYKGDKLFVRVFAEHIRELDQPNVVELEGMKMELYHQDGKTFDLIRSEKAQYNVSDQSLFSDGDVDITMDVPAGEEPSGRLLHIRGSGVQFSGESGKVSTDRMATFEFDRGGGSSVGADYDPDSRELHLHSEVKLDWKGKNPDAKPMHAEAGEAMYYERDSKVDLFPWSRLSRGTLKMDAGPAEVHLEEGVIQSAKVQSARGVQDDPGRKVEYAADELLMNFGEHMAVHDVHGERNARVVSTAHASRTTVTSDRMDLDFAESGKDSVLATAVAAGKGQVEAVPLPKPGVQLADTRILKSDTIRLTMRPGGEEIDKVETDGPGTLDFIPNVPAHPKRFLQGDRFWIAYGPENRIQSFRSVNVSTRTEKPPPTGKPAPPPMLTWSKEIQATFDARTGELSTIQQNNDFRYEEGDRRASADRATLEQATDLIALNGSARAQDPRGSVSASQIMMNQKSGDTTAEGRVTSIRQPDHRGKSSSMLSSDEVLQAAADRMTSSDNNDKIDYEGHARAWQAANRVDADRIDIDNKRHVMEAHGNVRSEFVDKAPDKDKGKDKSAKNKTAAAPPFTVVRAPDLVYTDETRTAFYSGGVRLERSDGLTVDSQELRAFFKNSEKDSDSSLEKAIADGAVKIVSVTMPTAKNRQKRTRTATSEHAEYYTADQKVIMHGGHPLLVDTKQGETSGQELTWWANDDRLLVDGKEGKAESSIRKK
jgi:lipopolysaccharide export system protein LptA